MGKYITRQDIEDVFGPENVDTWADLNSTEDAGEITARIDRAITRTETRVEDTFRGSNYALPFVPKSTGALESLKYIMARLAGVEIYVARGLRDNETTADKMAFHLTEAEQDLAAYASGERRLDIVERAGGQHRGAIVAHGRNAAESTARAERGTHTRIRGW